MTPAASPFRDEKTAWLLDPLLASDELVEFLTGPACEIVASVVRTEQVAA